MSIKVESKNLPHPASPCKGAGRIKVAVGMSGGVDSAVAAAILKKQGYDVVGFMMKLWSDPSCKVSKDNACCDIEGLHDAKKIASMLKIPFYVVDVREKFKKEVADYFVEEYKNLRTPNPCVKCNEQIKFGWLLDFAKKTGCDYLATGHYARIASDSGVSSIKYQVSSKEKNSEIQFPKPINRSTDQPVNYHLLRGKDDNKDQSYFLYGLNQEQLSHIIFPVGDLTKLEVRKLAKKWGLPVFEKSESQEICFVQEKDYREFLKKHIPDNFFKPGDIADTEGNVLGKHNGLINYTIGQRKGIEQSGVLQISKSEFLISNKKPKSKIDNHKPASSYQLPATDKAPLYVIGFDVKNNRLIVGNDLEIYRKEMQIGDLKWISENNKQLAISNKQIFVKIRYRHEAVPCKVYGIGNKVSSKKSATRYLPAMPSAKLMQAGDLPTTLRVVFDEKQRAITPGQSAVFYSNDEVLGGGIIVE